jgi:hypothetical protein
MHPDISRQLAAERLADFHRQADALALARRRPRARRNRLRGFLRLAAPRPSRAAAR